MSFHVEPKLTEDTTLKRARVDLDAETSAVRVTGVTPTDLSPITEALGDPDDAAWSGVGNATVISLLKGINEKTEREIAGFASLTPDSGYDYFYPYNPTKILPWKYHYGAGTFDTSDYGWTPPKSGYYKASFTGRVRASSSSWPTFYLNYHVEDADGVNKGSIGSIYVPAGITTDAYCIHVEFFFNISDLTKKVYFRGYNATGYPAMGSHVIYVNDACLTYEYLGE